MSIGRRTPPATWNSGTSSVATTAIPLPADCSVGDLLVVALSSSSTTTTFSNLNGWTVAASEPGATSGCLFVLTKTASSGDTGGGKTCAVTLGASSRMSGYCEGLFDSGGGALSVDGSVNVATANTTAAGGSINAPASGTPSSGADFAINAIAGLGSTSGDQPVFTAPSGWTIEAQTSSTSTTLKNSAVAFAYQQLSSGAATAQATYTANVSLSSWQTATVLVIASSSTSSVSGTDSGTMSSTSSIAEVITSSDSFSCIQKSTALDITGSSTDTASMTSFASVSTGVQLAVTYADLVVPAVSATPVASIDSATLTDVSAAAITQALSSSETATLSEGSTLIDNLSLARTDTAALTEASTAASVTPISGTDSATLAEDVDTVQIDDTLLPEATLSDVTTSLVVALASSDSAALTEARTVVVSYARTDSGALSESSSKITQDDLASSDAITFTDASNVNTLITPVSSSDSAALTESSSVAPLVSSDSAGFSESSLLTITTLKSVITADSGTLSEARSFGVDNGTGDAFTLSEVSSLDATSFADVITDDAATLTESSGLLFESPVVTADSVVLSESTAVDADVAGSADSATLTEVGNVVTTTVLIPIASSDTAELIDLSGAADSDTVTSDYAHLYSSTSSVVDDPQEDAFVLSESSHIERRPRKFKHRLSVAVLDDELDL